MRRALALALLALVTLVVAAPAAAHTPSVAAPVVVGPVLTETLTSAAPEPTAPWLAITLLAGAALVAAWRPRRALAVVLILVVGVLAFETGVHSTHHIGRSATASCTVEGVAAQLSAGVVQIALDVPPVPLQQPRVAAAPAPIVAARAVAPDA